MNTESIANMWQLVRAEHHPLRMDGGRRNHAMDDHRRWVIQRPLGSPNGFVSSRAKLGRDLIRYLESALGVMLRIPLVIRSGAQPVRRQNRLLRGCRHRDRYGLVGAAGQLRGRRSDPAAPHPRRRLHRGRRRDGNGAREIGMFATVIDTTDNVHTVVGNNKIFADNITNFTTNPTGVDLACHCLGHGVDPRLRAGPAQSRLARFPTCMTEPAPDVEDPRVQPGRHRNLPCGRIATTATTAWCFDDRGIAGAGATDGWPVPAAPGVPAAC